MERQYYRVMLGKGSKHAELCHVGEFIGGDWHIRVDLAELLRGDVRAFNEKVIPLYLDSHPGKSRRSAGLAGGMLFTICKRLQAGAIVLCPSGEGSYWVGEVAGDYYYEPGDILPHRRKVRWLPVTIDRAEMSQGLQRSTGSIGTAADIGEHGPEIEKFIGGKAAPTLISTDQLVEDPNVFALEEHLEDFLVANWASTEFGKNYKIFEEDGEPVGKQFPADNGRMDILAESKDGKELLVVELKKGRASDAVVGQVLRYMGYAKDELADPDQTVRGVIIALEDDQKLRRALSVVPTVSFYRYQVSFKLFKA